MKNLTPLSAPLKGQIKNEHYSRKSNWKQN